MTLALQIRGLRKRYTVGVGACAASADVLRGVELTVRSGEAVAIVGEAGSGKSTLLLCAAGLLAADAGDIEWFGSCDRATAVRRVMYHVARTDLMRSGAAGEPHLHLMDLRDGVRVAGWLSARREAGDAIIVSARTSADVDELVDRALVLRGGVLRPLVRAASRVAEAAGRR